MGRERQMDLKGGEREKIRDAVQRGRQRETARVEREGG